MRLPGRKRTQGPSARQWKKPAENVRDHLAVRRALSGQLISLAQLVGRPIRDPQGTTVSRMNDVVVRWDTGATHPLVTGILADARKGYAFIAVRDIVLEQTGARLRSSELVVGTPVRGDGDVALARDVLDRQLVDVTGVQVVRAADVYLVNWVKGWELAGIDVGQWGLFRRLLPQRWARPTPDRFIDWADLQAFVPRFDETSSVDPNRPAASAGVTGSSVQLASPAADLHRLRGEGGRSAPGGPQPHPAGATRSTCRAVGGGPGATRARARQARGPIERTRRQRPGPTLGAVAP